MSVSIVPTVGNLSQFDTQVLMPNKTKETLAGVFLLNNSSHSLEYTIVCNTESVYSPLVSLNTVSMALINLQTSSNISINMLYDPLPLTWQQKIHYYNPTTSFLIAIVFSIALAYKYGSIISQIVKERTSNCKHLQWISGMGLFSYWIGNFLFDYASYLVFVTVSLLICKAFEIT